MVWLHLSNGIVYTVVQGAKNLQVPTHGFMPRREKVSWQRVIGWLGYELKEEGIFLVGSSLTLREKWK
jgi:hypothetical protein